MNRVNVAGRLEDKHFRLAALVAFVLLVVWLSHFWHIRELGLYEDDYNSVRFAMMAQPLQRWLSYLVSWPQGRPLEPIAHQLPIRLIGLRLPVLHLLGFFIIGVNAILVITLARRITGSDLFALVAATMFALSPADTTHALLRHGLTLYPAVMFALVAAYLYLSDKLVPSYVVAFVGLLIYETPILIFLATPLLKNRWHEKDGVRELLRHGLVVVLMISLTVAIRIATQESRVADALSSPLEVIVLILRGIVFGTYITLRQLSYGPWRMMPTLRISVLSVGALTVPFVAALFEWLRHSSVAIPQNPAFALPAPTETSDHIDLKTFGRLAASALLMLVIGYLLSFTHNPLTVAGRLSSVHTAASVGASMLVATLIMLLLTMARRPLLQQLIIFGFALHIGVLVAFRYNIQRDFVDSWHFQQWFWTNIIVAAPDVEDGTVIFIDGENLPQTHYIQTNSWTDVFIMEVLYHLPDSWDIPPRVFLINGGELSTEGDSLLWNHNDESYPLDYGNIIYLYQENGRLVRSDAETMTIDKIDLQLKPVEGSTPLPTTSLYHELISSDWLTLPEIRNTSGHFQN